MIELRIPSERISGASVNIEALNIALRATLAEKLRGISTGPGGVVVHLDDSATLADVDSAESIATSHDPATRTPRQQRIRARRDALANARDRFRDALNLDDYQGEAQVIRRLAERLIWLETELRDLRDL